jgi:CheY-like chemotaxis protein
MAERTERHRWARLRHDNRDSYPVHYQGQWFRIAERHDPDVPTTDRIWLAVSGQLSEVKAAHFEIAERSRRRILVVDDDTSIRQTLQIALSKAGYEVLQARDGEEAGHIWRETGPDLVIADIHMPRKSGLLLMQELQESGSSTRVIAMTDGGPLGNRSLLGVAELLGAVRKMPKPFTVDAILEAVQQELGSTAG